jgi:molybdate transport system ATP-binding protein
MDQTRLGPRSAGPEPFITVQGAVLGQADGGSEPGITWQILADQHWAVIGANGSGKSSLMQTLSGRRVVGAGCIVYHFADQVGCGGASRPRGSTARDQVAHVDFRMQRAFLSREAAYHQARWNSISSHDAPLVSEYLSEEAVKRISPYQLAKSRLAPEQFEVERDRVITLLGIEALLERRLVQISSGERRKVLLAKALLQKPRLLILENPLAGLDQAFRARLRKAIEGLMLGDMRVVVATTSWEEIPAGVTHVLVLAGRRIVAQGPRGAVEARVRKPDAIWPRTGRAGSVPVTVSASRDEEQQLEDSVLIQMEGVRVSYGGFPVLDGVEWTVRRGEHWALLGPNGAGKSTLLSLVLGDNPQAYANRVSLFGRRRGTGESIWDVKERIGWLAPELQFLVPDRLSCLDVVCSGFFDSVGLYRRPSSQHREEASQWLARLGMQDLLEEPFGMVAQGEQRLVLMARAVVKRPSLLVLDEPCQGLDAVHRGRILDAVDEAGRSLDASVIYVTHDPRALPSIVSHVLKLDRGRVAARGRVNGHNLWV